MLNWHTTSIHKSMSEWYDSQKKPNSDFRQFLQERMDKANLGRQLTSEETKHLSKLEAIASRLKRGENVQNRQLQTWLSADEYEQIAAEWDTQKHFTEELKDKPSELKRYEDKLKEAIMMRNRSDAYHRKGKKSAAYKLDGKCESLCEDALEILQEIVAADASLQIWLDRHLDIEHGSLIDASLGNLPRLVTSRSIGSVCIKVPKVPRNQELLSCSQNASSDEISALISELS
jgi:hypothetical protein